MSNDSTRSSGGSEPADPKQPQEKKDENADERTQEGEIAPQPRQGGSRPPVRGEDGPSDPGPRERATP